jgi:hypothetical protein
MRLDFGNHFGHYLPCRFVQMEESICGVNPHGGKDDE